MTSFSVFSFDVNIKPHMVKIKEKNVSTAISIPAGFNLIFAYKLHHLFSDIICIFLRIKKYYKKVFTNQFRCGMINSTNSVIIIDLR